MSKKNLAPTSVDSEMEIYCRSNSHVTTDLRKKNSEFNIETHHLFIDLKTGYDSINRDLLNMAMT